MLTTLNITMCAMLLVMVVVIVANQLEWKKNEHKEVITDKHKDFFSINQKQAK